VCHANSEKARIKGSVRKFTRGQELEMKRNTHARKHMDVHVQVWKSMSTRVEGRACPPQTAHGIRGTRTHTAQTQHESRDVHEFAHHHKSYTRKHTAQIEDQELHCNGTLLYPESNSLDYFNVTVYSLIWVYPKPEPLDAQELAELKVSVCMRSSR
jgi:hypothetical protein